MRYDTLILSGGSIKGIALLGVFKYIFDNKIILRKELKHIISASAGALLALVILLDINIKVFYKILKQMDVDVIDKENFGIENFINDFGFCENIVTQKYVKSIIKNILHRDNITLKELYDISKIKYTVKVANITRNDVEYINYLNYPDIDLITLLTMATCVPLIFKPILYNNCLYNDGATGGGLPIEYNNSNNYLGIILYPIDINKKAKKFKKDILNYLYNVIYINNQSNDFYHYKKYENIIILDLKIPLKFSVTEQEKEQLFIEGYIQTKKFFNDS